jgi:hypothetical protein
MRLADFMLSSLGRSFDFEAARTVPGRTEAIALAAFVFHQPAKGHLVGAAGIGIASVIIADACQSAKGNGFRMGAPGIVT